MQKYGTNTKDPTLFLLPFNIQFKNNFKIILNNWSYSKLG